MRCYEFSKTKKENANLVSLYQTQTNIVSSFNPINTEKYNPFNKKYIICYTFPETLSFIISY